MASRFSFLVNKALLSILLSVLCGILPSPALWGTEEFVEGQVNVGRRDNALHSLSKSGTSLKGDYDTNPRTYINPHIDLGPVPFGEKKDVGGGKGEPLQVGVGRDIPPPFDEDLQPLLTWYEVGRDQVAAFAVTSPEAKALRIGIIVTNMPEGAQVRFFSPIYPEQVFGPFTAQDFTKRQAQAGGSNKVVTGDAESSLEDQLFWSPVIEGDTVGVEISFPSAEKAEAFSIKVVRLSHLVFSLRDILERGELKQLSDVGRSSSCNVDVACRMTIPSNLKDAVAKIVLTDDVCGETFLCTGTLLNDADADSSIEYLMVASHCFNLEANGCRSDPQALAANLNTYWFFEKAACDAPAPDAVTHLVGGAELLSRGIDTDFVLMQLNDWAPAEVLFAGWTSEPLPASSTVIGIHHPWGDLKKWSEGTANGFADYLRAVNGTGNYLNVVWHEGTTEDGSSGSGLFDSDGFFRGNLSGGKASCSAPSMPDWYGRFDLTYPLVRDWLFVGAAALDIGVPVLSEVQVGESKEYKVRVTADQSELVVELSGLSQDADLYVRTGNRPTLVTWDCRPFLEGASAESCTLTNASDNTYYVRVRSHNPGTTYFTLVANAPPTAEPKRWVRTWTPSQY